MPLSITNTSLSNTSFVKEFVQTTTISAAPGLMTSSGVPTITSSLSPFTMPGTTSYKLLPTFAPISIAPTISTPFFFVSILPIPPPIAPNPQRITFTFFILLISFSKQNLFSNNLLIYLANTMPCPILHFVYMIFAHFLLFLQKNMMIFLCF